MSEDNLSKIREDLEYVRGAVDRHDDKPSSVHSRILWATFCLVGFIGIDWWPKFGSTFLMFGLPFCVAVEFVVGFAKGELRGKTRNENDWRVFLQIAGCTIAIMTVFALAIRGHLGNGYSLGQVILVVLGFHFLTAGIWADTAKRWRFNPAIFLSLCLTSGAILISFFPNGIWTALGVILAAIIAFDFRIPLMASQRTRQTS